MRYILSKLSTLPVIFTVFSFLLLNQNVYSQTGWSSVVSSTKNGLRSIYFVDANTGYAAGGLGTIVKTVDGGTKWISLKTGSQNRLHQVFL